MLSCSLEPGELNDNDIIRGRIFRSLLFFILDCSAAVIHQNTKRRKLHGQPSVYIPLQNCPVQAIKTKTKKSNWLEMLHMCQ